MAYTKKDEKSKINTVDETLEIFDKYSNKRDVWAQQAKEDKEFRLGKQWTAEQRKALKARGQAPIVINRVHPAVESAKAMLTANRPSFRAAAREDSDNKIAQVMSALLSYMYDVSDGRSVVRQAVDDYYVMGLGFLHVYQDPMKDMGKGEVCFHDVDPLDVYVDPNSRSRYFDDAENIIISKLFTKEQAKKLWPMYKEKIENATSKGAYGNSNDWNAPSTTREDDGEVQFPEDVGRVNNQEYIRGYERYYKKDVQEVRIFETWSGKEKLLNKEEFGQYGDTPIYRVQNEIIEDKLQALKIKDQLQSNFDNQYQTEVDEYEEAGLAESIPDIEIKEVNFEELTKKDLIEEKLIKVVKVLSCKIHQCVILGDTKLYERVLPIDKYPIVPLMNIHTRTPYPVSDVRMIKGLQEYINKTRSLIIAHATTSTNTKILVPEGSVDMKEFEEKWAQPGVAIPYDPTDGAPMPVQPTPLPNELYQNEQTAKNDIDHALGLYEMMMGNAQQAPSTYKATISIDEFGQRKMKSKLADIEAALTRVGQIAIPLMQQLYTSEKVFRIIQPNNSINKYVINKRLYDDKNNEIKIFNDISVGKYDIIVVTGSTLPSNRYAELEFYMDAYQKGLIDRQEVLKKTEVFDMQGVMERTDTISKLQQQLQGAQEQIKKLKGDMQSRDREAVNLRKRIEVEKFKSGLDGISNKAKASTSVYEKRLDDTLSTIKEQLKNEAKKIGSPSSGGKEAVKRRKK
mgnify:CR=1 FL=1|tara:strand:+ start:3320 stop:5539 length:2220 start_codon:yes stop_codon:yes gene_type:complete